VTSILVAIPSFDGKWTSGTARSLLRLQDRCHREEIKFEVSSIDNCAIVTHSRNHLVQQFLATDFENMLCLDADVAFQVSDILSALRSPYDVVCGVYPYRDGSNRLVVSRLRGAKPGLDGFIEIEASGTGCMLIKRRVLQRMIEQYPETYGYRSAGRIFHRLFDIDYEDGGLVGEDYAFCRRWRATGGKIYADTKADMVHVGTKQFYAPWYRA
jgi:hypothetical protein